MTLRSLNLLRTPKVVKKRRKKLSRRVGEAKSKVSPSRIWGAGKIFRNCPVRGRSELEGAVFANSSVKGI